MNPPAIARHVLILARAARMLRAPVASARRRAPERPDGSLRKIWRAALALLALVIAALNFLEPIAATIVAW